MKYLSVSKDDMNNGPGLRVVLWVSGCSHKCKGCHNPHTWNPNQGNEITDDFLKEIFDELGKDYIEGITYSGGDPLHPLNRESIALLTGITKKMFPNKTQWLYTGYTYSELIYMYDENIDKILENIDVLVDGRYDESLRSPNEPWVGSSNQRVIYLKNGC